ncbi:3-octaprenyl-4-hydroxybenzoate carboxy-lyase [Wigglesworthia glossinidia endosymbiont of Glossina morsitans morsitans (Yale colony)]|uniref:Flavin prenyltransferase UbiX n=1 Tax=Wigglesworthia glossinidia endosymbiont of Glossina morsitans morsitans (Yale colony) TaxID=1142511 RepID=H6Q503_WIGGL|nr:UbiX family flavin prenyltransferase [Wigglesworthia glossinidia]AFA41286.1 3-octaprenyl-4-hydroxybenzoate carboxy-lyase [Wigglesworthia glossinidia endosymbiont of Glossina morsitans morsitans (Yale colony)]
MQNLIIGISGASGIIYGIRLLKILKITKKISIHLIVTKSAKKTLFLETNYSLKEINSMANVIHNIHDISANISSGSYKTIGMIIIPCTIKTLSGIVNSYNDSLLIRAADVVLKEKRKLVLSVRETPLHTGHLDLMLRASKIGAIIMPPTPAFYHNPKTLDDIINHTVIRILDQFHLSIADNLIKRWSGKKII